MNDKVTIPVAARRVKRTPAALYAAIKRGELKTAKEYGVVVVSLAEARRYVRGAKSGPKNGKPAKKK